MIGLRAENDRSSKSFFTNAAQGGVSNRRSYRFAERYGGRFFVSGVSGSFSKHARQLQATEKKYLRPAPAYQYEPVLERHQKEELRREAVRLLEMEEQLAELQRLRELKRQRDRARRKKKLEYNAAQSVQQCFKRFLTRRADGAVDAMVCFLRVIEAKQAIANAAWAAAVIARFAQRAGRLWRLTLQRRRVAHAMAVENWWLVQEVASIYTLARRRAADECVFVCLREGLGRATEKQLALDEGQAKLRKARRKALQRKQKEKEKSKKVVKEDNFQFFMTEYDELGGTGGSLSSTSKLSDGGGFDEDSDSEEESRVRVRLGVDHVQARAPVRVFDRANPDHARIIELHAQRQAAQKVEHARRMQLMKERERRQEGERRAGAERERVVKEEEAVRRREQLASLVAEGRVKAERARTLARVKMEREAARKRKAAADMQDAEIRAREGAQMLQWDKEQHRGEAEASMGERGRGAQRTTSAGHNRGTSTGAGARAHKRTRSAENANADWTELPRNRGTEHTEEAESEAEAAKRERLEAARERARKRVVAAAAVQAAVVVCAVEPKKPGVPRLADPAAIERARLNKQKQEDMVEAMACQVEADRRNKFTSDDAVQRNRAAVQKRLADKKRRAREAKEEEEKEEAERRRNVEGVLALAAERLKRDLDKKRRKEIDRRKSMGLDTTSAELIGVGYSGENVVKERRKLKNKSKQTGNSPTPSHNSQTSPKRFIETGVDGALEDSNDADSLDADAVLRMLTRSLNEHPAAPPKDKSMGGMFFPPDGEGEGEEAGGEEGEGSDSDLSDRSRSKSGSSNGSGGSGGNEGSRGNGGSGNDRAGTGGTGVSSAHEGNSERDFGVGDFEDFFTGGPAQLLYRDTGGALVKAEAGEGDVDEEAEALAWGASVEDLELLRSMRQPTTTTIANTSKGGIYGGKTKVLTIPKQLHNTPYFAAYLKHTDSGEGDSTAPAPPAPAPTPGPPPAAKNRQKGASTSAPAPALDEEFLEFQANQQMGVGRVASLLRMVSKARSSLNKGQGMGVGVGQGGMGEGIDSETEGVRPSMTRA
ncbi:hypothetical protein B484DRAFT_443855, partial [Ochromonadaceae sp. CCMP2298]